VCFTAVRDVLNKTGVTPRQVKVVVVNCSLFNPTPSLSATIMNHFKMGSDTINYNLSGMGCSGEGDLGGFWGFGSWRAGRETPGSWLDSPRLGRWRLGATPGTSGPGPP
jgi:hypothetical protein